MKVSMFLAKSEEDDKWKVWDDNTFPAGCADGPILFADYRDCLSASDIVEWEEPTSYAQYMFVCLDVHDLYVNGAINLDQYWEMCHAIEDYKRTAA